MRAILVRVGADRTPGGGKWLGPVDPDSLRFAYIPIPENTTAFYPGCERRFDEVEGPLMGFLSEHRAQARYWQHKIVAKRGQPMHLDPDYEHLTYGDLGDVRGRDLREFGPGDLIVFYSGLKPIRATKELVYAVVGLYVIDEIVFAPSVPDSRRGENAHTRKANRAPRDIVVRARPAVSGRCARCIPIGERRGGSSYYLRPDVERAWGGLVKADGTPWKSPWLNMSATLPLLGDAAGFARWWQAQEVPLVRRNYIA